MVDIQSVSYTHLDVYKRQIFRKAKALLLVFFSKQTICMKGQKSGKFKLGILDKLRDITGGF